MTTEEEITFLKGRIDALSKLCSFLIATHSDGDSFAGMYKMRALKELGRPALSGGDLVYAEGFASIVQELETAQKTFRAANQNES